jgi:hypothetical protein
MMAMSPQTYSLSNPWLVNFRVRLNPNAGTGRDADTDSNSGGVTGGGGGIEMPRPGSDEGGFHTVEAAVFLPAIDRGAFEDREVQIISLPPGDRVERTDTRRSRQCYQSPRSCPRRYAHDSENKTPLQFTRTPVRRRISPRSRLCTWKAKPTMINPMIIQSSISPQLRASSHRAARSASRLAWARSLPIRSYSARTHSGRLVRGIAMSLFEGP